MCPTTAILLIIIALAAVSALRQAYQSGKRDARPEPAKAPLHIPPALERTALPLAVLAAFLLTRIPLVNIVTQVVSMAFHEVGHALVSWLSGIPSVPTFFFSVCYSEDRSAAVSLVVIALVAALAVWSFRARRLLPAIITAALVVAAVILSFGVSLERSKAIMLFFGLGGELVLSAIGLLLFYQRWDPSAKAQQIRWLLLICSALAFARAASLWIGVAAGTAKLPMGAAIDFGLAFDGESSGDLDRLIREYGWSEQAIASRYLTLTICSAVSVAVGWCWMFSRHFPEKGIGKGLK